MEKSKLLIRDIIEKKRKLGIVDSDEEGEGEDEYEYQSVESSQEQSSDHHEKLPEIKIAKPVNTSNTNK